MISNGAFQNWVRHENHQTVLLFLLANVRILNKGLHAAHQSPMLVLLTNKSWLSSTESDHFTIQPMQYTLQRLLRHPDQLPFTGVSIVAGGA